MKLTIPKTFLTSAAATTTSMTTRANTHPTLKAVSQKLLDDRSYDIEFNGYLSNHAKHAIIALDRLDASPARIQEWWDIYTATTPYGLHLKKANWDNVKPSTLEEWKEWRGKKINFASMATFLEKELETKGEDELLKTYCTPELLAGMAGSLTHGLIHLGWAIDAASSPYMLVEGLTYLNFCHLPMVMQPSKPTKNTAQQKNAPKDATPLDSLLRVADMFHKENLGETWVEPLKAKYDETFHPELVPAGFQWHLAKVLEEPHPLLTQIPDWSNTLDSEEKVLEHLYRALTYVYLNSRDENGNGSFLLLHGITSLWGLEQILKTEALKDDAELAKTAVGQFYGMLLALLATNPSSFPTREALESVAEAVPASSTNEGADWSQLIKDAHAEEEEHNIKLVYVCKELWKRYGYWSGFYDAARAFTLTPNIGGGSSSSSSVAYTPE